MTEKADEDIASMNEMKKKIFRAKFEKPKTERSNKMESKFFLIILAEERVSDKAKSSDSISITVVTRMWQILTMNLMRPVKSPISK